MPMCLHIELLAAIANLATIALFFSGGAVDSLPYGLSLVNVKRCDYFFATARTHSVNDSKETSLDATPVIMDRRAA